MAAGIGEVAARAGHEVILRGRSEASLKKAKAAMAASLERAVITGKLDPQESAAALARVTMTLTDGDLAEADVVVEAIAEDAAAKLEVWSDLEAAVKPDALLATATSSLPVIDLAAATGRPERVVGLHFFNPAPVMRLVEVVRTVATSPEVDKRAVSWVRGLGKRPVRCRDRAGFIVNYLLFPYLNDAVHMHEEGYGTPQDIDTAMKLGCGHPLGPFELLDRIGLDVSLAILNSLHGEFRERRHAPAPLLEHMVRAGYLGVKSGRGFYKH
jgi:3-hydroxybutyryl-CoA dehydrogenase